MGFEEFDTGNDRKFSSKNERYKGRTGETDRLSFVWFSGLKESGGTLDLTSDPKFVGANRIYHPEAGYVIDGGPEFVKLSLSTGGSASKMAIATVVVQWPTDRNGQIEKSRFAKGDFSVVPWVFSKDKYQSLKKVHERFHFGKHDITVDCSDTQFQKMSFISEHENLLAKLLDKNPDMAADVLERSREVLATLRNNIGRPLSIEEFKEKVGKSDDIEGLKVSESDITGVMDDILG